MGIYTDEQICVMNLVSIINEWMKPKKPGGTIYQYTPELQLVSSYDSAADAAKALKIKNTNISSVRAFISQNARGKKRIGYGYIWSYLKSNRILELYNILKEQA